MDEKDNKLAVQMKYLKDTYNKQIKDFTNIEIITNNTLNVFGDNDTEKIAQQVLEKCNINTEELLKEGIKINDNNPNISKQDLAIQLLSKVADNKKYKKMSKIAKEMLKERWWEKNE